MGKFGRRNTDIQSIYSLHFHSLLLLLQQLSPTDKSLHTDWENELNDAKEYVRKLNIISTNKDREVETETEEADTEVSIKCA